MPSLRLLAIIVGHVIFAIASYETWALGRNFAPELMVSEVVAYPLIMGVVGIWIWYGFWSTGVLRGPKQVRTDSQ